MVHHGCDLSYDTCWRIPKHNQTQINYRSLIVLYLLQTYSKANQKLFNNIIYIKTNDDSVIVLRIHQGKGFSSLYSNDMNFIVIVRWIFHLPDFLKSFIISHRCGQMFSKQRSIFNSSSPSLLIWYTYYYQRCLLVFLEGVCKLWVCCWIFFFKKLYNFFCNFACRLFHRLGSMTK